MVISIDVEEAFDKIQHSYDKNSPENRDTENLLQNNKAKYDKSAANTSLNGAKLNALSLRSGTRQACPLSPLFLSIIFGNASHSNQRRKWKKESKLENKKENCHFLQVTWYCTQKILKLLA